jgi:hypothetical protein
MPHLLTLIGPFLETAERDSWKHFVMDDESLARDEVATKTRTDIASKKFMFTITWNPFEFHVVSRVPTGTHVNRMSYTTKLLCPLY